MLFTFAFIHVSFSYIGVRKPHIKTWKFCKEQQILEITILRILWPTKLKTNWLRCAFRLCSATVFYSFFIAFSTPPLKIAHTHGQIYFVLISTCLYSSYFLLLLLSASSSSSFCFFFFLLLLSPFFVDSYVSNNQCLSPTGIKFIGKVIRSFPFN